MSYFRRRRNSKSVFFLLLGIFSLLVLFFITFRLLKVRQIECYSQFGPCPDDVNSKLTHFIGLPILAPLPKSQVVHDLAGFPQIESLSLYRRLPSVLVVAISLRQPLGSLGQSVLGAQSVADSSGFIFQKIGQSTLPTLIVNEVPSLATKISPDQLLALQSLKAISSMFDTQVSGTLNGHDLSISAPGDLTILIDVAKPQSNWYTPLQLILHRSKINAKMPHKIDLRFTDSVITY